MAGDSKQQQIVDSELWGERLAHRVNNPLTYVTANLMWIREQLVLGVIPPADVHELIEAVDESLDGAKVIADVVQGYRRCRTTPPHARGAPERQGALHRWCLK